ncbi:MAG: tetratricopeptide repeat protein [Rivularia sp. ALOHA_DT_140]|nr:tetratricopeptide repeat protein [Rivularia sp. ALOHA_DT_140]
MKLEKLRKQIFIFTFLLVNIGSVRPVKANIFTEKVVIQSTIAIPDSANNNQNNNNNYILAMLVISGIGFVLGLKFPFSLLHRTSTQAEDKHFLKVSQSETSIKTQIGISSNKKATSQYLLYIKKAYNNFAQGDIEGALKNFNEAIRNQPNNAKVYSERAYFRKNKLGDKEGAIADYTQAINMNPDYALFYFCRSQTYLEMGEKQKSIEDYNTAMGICK